MSAFNIQKNRFMKKANEKKIQKEILTNPILQILNKDEEMEDLNSSTSPCLSVPIFSPTKFIFPTLASLKKIK
ncbi:unnamed protein product [Paramecium sonneborni]|uniref:Uncharacterized protein n=1 Tax=Paramecium sonneborni TaxID=65129 RepID=A0A8S1QJN3_9CILI|nr:unnamed protein product [Paramecium sonneborni]